VNAKNRIKFRSGNKLPFCSRNGRASAITNETILLVSVHATINTCFHKSVASGLYSHSSLNANASPVTNGIINKEIITFIEIYQIIIVEAV
jgi:hypothetical protein